MVTDLRDAVSSTRSVVRSLLSDLTAEGSGVSHQALQDFMSDRSTTCSLVPWLYSDANEFLCDYQSLNFTKKLVWPGSSSDTRGPAIQKWRECEARNAETNVRLSRETDIPHGMWTKLELARAHIQFILGRFDFDEMAQCCAFGPGADLGSKRRDAHRIKKIGNKPTVSGTCLPLLKAYQAWDHHLGDVHASLHGESVVICDAGRLDTVPKTSTEDRTIDIQPSWNLFFQKGIGTVIRRRLSQYGLDLNFQSEVNRELARQGSVDGRLATVDLSSASDLICSRLVEYLLPSDWWTVLSVTRTSWSLVNGEKVFLRKFSSMGNGFTFELESLIFYALAWACCSPCSRRVNVDVAAFGDDIIVPSDRFTELATLLEFCGMVINRNKSFWAGPFRESCGAHWFEGVDVTPVYLKKVLRFPCDLYWCANALSLLAERLGRFVYRSKVVFGSYLLARDMIPGKHRYPVPKGFGDIGLVSSFDEAVPNRKKARRGWDGWTFTAWVGTQQRLPSFEGPCALVSALWLMRRENRNGEDQEQSRFRLGRMSYRRKRLLCIGQWPHLGPWA